MKKYNQINVVPNIFCIGKYTSNFGLMENLGTGGFGTVYEGYQIGNSDNKVAIKMINLENDKTTQEKVLNQIKLMVNNQSDGVVKIFAYQKIKHGPNYQWHYGIVMERMHGSLKKLLKENKNYSEEEALKIIWKIIKCYEVLYKAGIIHRDLKLDNILYSKLEGQLIFKITDFGFARDLHINPFVNSFTAVHSLGYSAPQLIRGQKLTIKADAYSLGCILFQLLLGPKKFPIQMGCVNFSTYETNFQKIEDVLRKAGVSNPVIEFIQQCLISEEGPRISWKQIFENQIFTRFIHQNETFLELIEKNNNQKKKINELQSNMRELQSVCSQIFNSTQKKSFSELMKLLIQRNKYYENMSQINYDLRNENAHKVQENYDLRSCLLQTLKINNQLLQKIQQKNKEKSKQQLQIQKNFNLILKKMIQQKNSKKSQADLLSEIKKHLIKTKQYEDNLVQLQKTKSQLQQAIRQRQRFAREIKSLSQQKQMYCLNVNLKNQQIKAEKDYAQAIIKESKQQIQTAQKSLEDAKRIYQKNLEDAKRMYQKSLEDAKRMQQKSKQSIKKIYQKLQKLKYKLTPSNHKQSSYKNQNEVISQSIHDLIKLIEDECKIKELNILSQIQIE